MIYKFSLTWRTVILFKAATFKSDSSVYVLRNVLQQYIKNKARPINQNAREPLRSLSTGNFGQKYCRLHAFATMKIFSNR